MQKASFITEKIVGHGSSATTADVSNPAQDPKQFADGDEKMLALTWQRKGKVHVEETFKPRIIDPRDVIVKVTGSTICGSDLHLLHGSIAQLKSGDILGHEFCGIVESLGEEAKARGTIKEGQRVVASFQIACGSCRYCKQKLSSMCERTNPSGLANAMWGKATSGFFGYSHLTGGYAGGQAEYVRVPFGDVNLLPLPDDVPDEKGLYLSDVLCTSYHSVVDTGVQKGDTVAIWGGGPIGLMAAYFAVKRGASRTILVDGVQWRLDWAKHKIPEVEVLNYKELPKGESVPSALRKMVDGGLDCAIDAAGGEYSKGWAHYLEITAGVETDTAEVINEMITSVHDFGRCGIIAAYAGFANHVNVGALMERGIRLIGNGQAPVHKYWEELLQEIREGKIDPTIMLSHRFKMEDTAKAYHKFDARDPKDRMMKVFIQTKHSFPRAKKTPMLSMVE